MTNTLWVSLILWAILCTVPALCRYKDAFTIHKQHQVAYGFVALLFTILGILAGMVPSAEISRMVNLRPDLGIFGGVVITMIVVAIGVDIAKKKSKKDKTEQKRQQILAKGVQETTRTFMQISPRKEQRDARWR